MNLYQHDLMSMPNTDKLAVQMGDGWCTFPDLDNFDSDKLLRALTLKEKDYQSDSIWDPSLSYSESCQRKGLSVSALRQLEALFNLSQLLFGLSRAETVNYTFRDLQLRKCPHSFKKAGFKMLHPEGRNDFYAIFEQLVHNIIQEGGLEVTLLIYKNPMLPMVRQKCLDLVSNLTTVPSVAYQIMKYQSWFLDHLLIMVRDGDIISDKIPALSVLIRLLKVMLLERMQSSYMKLIDMQYIDCIVDIFETSKYQTDQTYIPFFIKFEFISMQSLTVILGDQEYSNYWSDKAKTRLLNYCMIVLLKAAGALTDANETINHIFYAEQHTNKHSLAHTIMTVTELLRNDSNMRSHYRYHKPFKQLIVQLIEKYGAKSLYIKTDPGISYALNHLIRVLYLKSSVNTNTVGSLASAAGVAGGGRCVDGEQQNNGKSRTCANGQCRNEETKYKRFKECQYCEKAAYCSRKCRKIDALNHRKSCFAYFSQQQKTVDGGTIKHKEFLSPPPPPIEKKQEQQQQQIITKIEGGGGGGQYEKRRVSDFVQNQHRRNISQSGKILVTTQTISYSQAKKLSKFQSMNEKKRASIATTSTTTSTLIQNNQLQQQQQQQFTSTISRYNKHSTASFKEPKSRAPTTDQQASRPIIDDQRRYSINAADNLDLIDNSVQFVRPLKTSTQLCLVDLNSKSNISTASSSSSSTTTNQHHSATTSKSSSTNDETTKKEQQRKTETSNKRRHSCAAAVVASQQQQQHELPSQTPTTISETPTTPHIYNNQQTKMFFYHGNTNANNNTGGTDSQSSSSNKNSLKKAFSSNSSLSSLSSDDDSSSSSSNEPNTVNDDPAARGGASVNHEYDEPIEGEREQTKNTTNGQKQTSTDRLYPPSNDDYYIDSNDDEQERQSQLKLMKELERTINFVTNCCQSNTANNDNFTCITPQQIDCLNNGDDDDEVSTDDAAGVAPLRGPQISLATIYYDDEDEEENGGLKRNSQSIESLNGNNNNSGRANRMTIANRNQDNYDDDDDDIIKDTSQIIVSNNQQIAKEKLIINNSIDSISFKEPQPPQPKIKKIQQQHHKEVVKRNFGIINENDEYSSCNSNNMTANDDDMSIFNNINKKRNEIPLINNYNEFKKPLIINNNEQLTTAGATQQQQQQQSLPLSLQPIDNKSNKIDYSILSTGTIINTNKGTGGGHMMVNQPHESTPIHDFEFASNARRKQLLQQFDLNSTIRNPQTSSSQQKQQPAVIAKPLKQIQSLNIIHTQAYAHQKKQQMLIRQQQHQQQQQQQQQKEAFNMSQYAAMVNASSTNSLVQIAKADVPKNVKKTLEKDVKKEKKSCIIS